ncbi:hypothetical protein MKQ70_29210 [Chitinophaga sedimenti]|uniref:hypothetical protein n=1 Tax=Chitinophaga sedimenti TaxID=2033606 RepID=UPI0020029EE3|nr:hypothetical protein [Chitinophaga sedimenti]MCK7558841.1 hypothetical protein [Chitinophaga sedimenti]
MFVTQFKRAPFVRLLPPLVAGILLQHYLHFTLLPLFGCMVLATVLLISMQFWGKRLVFVLKWGRGVLVFFLR